MIFFLGSRTSLTTWFATKVPSFAKVANAPAWLSGLTSAVPSGIRESRSLQPAPFGAPAACAIFMILDGPSSICVVRSTKAVLMESVVALVSVTDGPYWLENSLRTGVDSPGGMNVLPLNLESRLKPSLRPAARAYVLKVEAVGRAVVAQFREFFTKSGPP